MRKKKAIILKADNGEFYYNLHGGNGKVLATSETMKRKTSVLTVLKNNFPDFNIVDKS